MGKSETPESDRRIWLGKQFECIEQCDDYACGAACLRMLEKWKKGECQEESYWFSKYGKPNDGSPPQKMLAALRKELVFGVRKCRDHSIPDDLKQPDVVYLLKTDCYGTNGHNYYHWIVLLDRVRSRSMKELVVYADPWFGELVVKPWNAIVAYEIRSMYRIVKPLAGE